MRRPDAAVGATAAMASAAASSPVGAQPASRLPTAEVVARPKPVASVERRVAQPGDRICSNCGEPNDAGRKFCRRCGNSLVEARVVAEKPVPWYRRIFRRTPTRPTQVAAGDRLGSMQAGAKQGIRGFMKLRTLAVGALGLLVAVGIFGYVGVPSVQKYVNEATTGGVPGILDRIGAIINPPQTIVRPVKDELTASSEVADHPVQKLFDGVSNSDWRADGETPSVTATFPEKVELLSVYVYSGVAGESFVDFRRPATLEFSFPDGTSSTVVLQDVHDKQFFELKASNVDQVTIKVLTTNGPADAPVAISEIEFFRKGSALAPQAS